MDEAMPVEPAAAGDLRLAKLTKRFAGFTAVDQLSLTIAAGGFFALLGPSGCGKTTTLRMVAGLAEPTAGQVLIGDRDVTRLRPYRRPVNTVFQSYALFPHLDVRQNVAFGLRRRGIRDVHARVDDILRLVRLDGYGPRRPADLSGGEQQRVALARALVNRPQVLLLDEPLGALDLTLRRQMQAELKRIQAEIGITFLHVTHDQEEAMTMADTIAVLNAGRIEQQGAPAEIYELPATPFVANFLGRCNLLPAEVLGRAGDDVLLAAYGQRFAVPASRSRATGRPVYLGIRPEKLHLLSAAGPAPAGHQTVAGVVTASTYLGVSTEYQVRTAWGAELSAFAPNTGAGGPLPPGTPVRAGWEPRHTFVLDRGSAGGEPARTPDQPNPLTQPSGALA